MSRARRPGGGPINRLLASRRVSTALQAAMAAELAADKLPFLPARVQPAPLAARALMGGVAGWVVGEHTRGSPLLCAIVGSAAAVAAAYAGFMVRRQLTTSSGLPVALAEDAVAVTMARRATLNAR